MVKFRDQLREELKDEIPEEFISFLPSGFQSIDFAAILNLKEELHQYSSIIGIKILRMIPKLKSVWLRKGKIEGKFREPGGLEFICGIKDTEVEHHENGIRYKFDFTKIMFAKGNVTERKLLPNYVQKDEIIVDMFAGIGYFSLGIGKYSKPARIYAIELNPESFKYLDINIRLNKLDKIITPMQGDSQKIVKGLSDQGIFADRIIMGVFPAPFEYLTSASMVVKKEELSISTSNNEFYLQANEKSKFDIYNEIDSQINNTIIHFEGVIMGRNIEGLFGKFETIMKVEGFKSSILAFRFVKSYGPKMWHLVLDIAVGL